MDKNEYRAKLDEISDLVDKQDYKGALKIAETIDWRRVRSARTLCMIGEIYEANKRYEESKKLLLLAHQRAPIGKTVLYRLVELSVKMGNFDEALNYYKLFVEISPNDNSRYILKYKIQRAKRAPIEEQISILQEYKDREYTERWAFELARLYAKAGMSKECVAECDDLILWFSEGKYVTKAMELKMKYAPLSAQQQTKYDKRFQNAPSASVSAMADVINAAAGAAAKVVAESPQDTVISPEQDKEIEEILNSIVIGDVSETSEPVKTQEETAEKGQAEPENEKAGFKPFHLGGNMTTGVKAEAPKSEMFQLGENPDASAFKADIKGQEFDLEALLAETANELAQAVAEDSDAEEKTEAAEEINEENISEEDTNKEDIQTVDADETELSAETEEKKPEEVAECSEPEEDEVKPSSVAENLSKALAAKAEAFAAMGFGDEELTEEAELEAVEELVEEVAEEVIEEPAEEDEPEAVEEVVEEVVEEAAEELTEEDEPDELEEVVEEIAEEAIDELAEEDESDELEEVVEEVIEETAEEEPEETVEEATSGEEEMEVSDGATKEIPVNEVKEQAFEIDFSKILEQELEDTLKPKEEESHMKRVAASVPEENAHESMAFNTAVEGLMRHHLTPEEHRRLFTYFAPIPGMTQQITEALDTAQSSACAKTSQAGNIIVTGREGSGKTRLSEGLIKALCKERQMEGAKVAFIDAETLNKKNPVTVVGKMAGGFLVVEHAGALEAEVVEDMSKAMEFKTNRLTVILEDLKPGIRNLEEKYPDFMKKFDSRITIPAFTNDELVSFAKTYAKELGYKIDDMAVLALYTLIGDNQNEENPVAVGLVREMMDDAIKKASRKGRRPGKKVGKRHLDESGRIMLYEKDFDV